MKSGLSILVTCLLANFTLSGCMMSSTHKQLMDDERAAATDLLESAKKKLTKERDEQSELKKKCEGDLKTTLGLKQKIEADLAARGMQIDTLLNEKGALTKERAKMSEEQKKLASQIQELNRMKAAAEKRSADYRNLLNKLRKMIDAGTLQVKIRNGRMLVQMSSDVVFPPASTRIKPEAKVAIEELAMTIATFAGRKFQVLGHSDSTPIRSARFPSNWELSVQRATEVVKLMVEAGVPPEMLSAAGGAEFDPLVDNETPENRSTNRRVEIIFMPKIDELPGFDEVLNK
ncbi:MAG: OmpA family protein [Deltaproteobacteria bacterium]|nr:OmpA family protein [Deltaproteobacteria bacterium]